MVKGNIPEGKPAAADIGDYPEFRFTQSGKRSKNGLQPGISSAFGLAMNPHLTVS